MNSLYNDFNKAIRLHKQMSIISYVAIKEESL